MKFKRGRETMLFLLEGNGYFMSGSGVDVVIYRSPSCTLFDWPYRLLDVAMAYFR